MKIEKFEQVCTQELVLKRAFLLQLLKSNADWVDYLKQTLFYIDNQLKARGEINEKEN